MHRYFFSLLIILRHMTTKFVVREGKNINQGIFWNQTVSQARGSAAVY